MGSASLAFSSIFIDLPLVACSQPRAVIHQRRAARGLTQALHVAPAWFQQPSVNSPMAMQRSIIVILRGSNKSTPAVPRLSPSRVTPPTRTAPSPQFVPASVQRSDSAFRAPLPAAARQHIPYERAPLILPQPPCRPGLFSPPSYRCSHWLRFHGLLVSQCVRARSGEFSLHIPRTCASARIQDDPIMLQVVDCIISACRPLQLRVSRDAFGFRPDVRA